MDPGTAGGAADGSQPRYGAVGQLHGMELGDAEALDFLNRMTNYFNEAALEEGDADSGRDVNAMSFEVWQ